jgi:hypothetical protein
MACGFGMLAEDCAADHVAPALGLRCTKTDQWSGSCPVCQGERCLSLTVKSGRLLWCCHRKPSCSTDAIRDALAVAVPCCFSPTRRGRPGQRTDKVNRSELAALLGLSGAALQLRVACLAWDCSPETAAAKLGMPGRTYRRAVTGF